MNSLIVCHCGPSIGLGHLKRSILIANLLTEKLNMKVSLLIQGETFKLKNIEKFSVNIIKFTDNLFLKIKQYNELSFIFLDLSHDFIPENITSDLEYFKKTNIKVISIDCLIDHSSLLDKIFIPSFFINPKIKISDISKVVYGWDCYLIDDSYNRLNWYPGNKVLILTGGSDTTNLGKKWPVRLNKILPKDCELTWVRGPFAKSPKIPKNANFLFNEKIAPSNLRSLMTETNYAITVYGVSFFELLKLGVPSIVFSPYSNKYNRELSEISCLKIAQVAKDENEATEMLVDLMNNNHLANDISTSSSKIIRESGLKKLENEVRNLLRI